MKSFTIASNAKRAARKLCDTISGIEAEKPTSGDNGEFFPAVRIISAITAELRAEIAEVAVITAKPAAEAAKTKPAKTARPAPAREPRPGDRGHKAKLALELMSRQGGAAAGTLQDELGWASHTVRGFVSVQNSKHERGITTKRANGVTTYSIARNASAD